MESSGKRKSGEGILFLTNDDLEFLGIDPAKVSDSQWEDILDYLRDYYNDNFSAVLAEAAEYVLAHSSSGKEE
jgi:hypothetical protein